MRYEAYDDAGLLFTVCEESDWHEFRSVAREIGGPAMELAEKCFTESLGDLGRQMESVVRSGTESAAACAVAHRLWALSGAAEGVLVVSNGLGVGLLDDRAADVLLKFDESQHPRDHGRFSEKPGAGEEFVSPNEEESPLTFSQAANRLTGERQKALKEQFSKVDAALGITATSQENAIGAWPPDGVENSTVVQYKNVDWETLRVSAAMKGWMANQKAVLVFQHDSDGGNILVNMTVPGTDTAKIHGDLKAAGIEYHTLVPRGDKTGVYVYIPDSTMDTKVISFKEKHNAEFEYAQGRGDFIGSDASGPEGRDLGRAKYAAEVAAFRGRGGKENEAVGKFERLRDNWLANPVKRAGEEDLTLKFDEDAHPRVPAGGHGGGQFTSGGEGGSSAGGKEGKKPFDSAEWEAKPVPARRAEWEALPVSERDRLADAEHTVGDRLQEHLKGVPDRPHTTELHKDLEERVKQFSDRVHPEAMEKISRIVNVFNSSLGEHGVAEKERRELGMMAVDTLCAQEMEACTRQLGDHGAAHIEGNIRIAAGILNQMPGGANPRDMAVCATAMIFHDAGYLATPAQHFLDEGHPRWSQAHFDERVRPLVEKVLGKASATEVSHVIRTHDSTELDWKNDPVASASRVADNTALFRKEKLPPVFRYVPENVQVLKDLAAKKISLDDAHKAMRENVEGSKLEPKIKKLLDRAVDEVSPITGKMTLGMLGGEIQKVSWNGTGVDVYLKENAEATELNKIGDFGQRQFGKMAETYGISPEQFQKDLSFEFKSPKTGDVLLRGIHVKPKKSLAGGFPIPSIEEALKF